MFRIVNLRTNIVWPDEKGESERIFKNGEEAAEAAKNLNTVSSNLGGIFTFPEPMN